MTKNVHMELGGEMNEVPEDWKSWGEARAADAVEPAPTDGSLPLEKSTDAAVAIQEIVRAGPSGAITVAGAATAVVIGLWLLFYFLVFLPRGVIQ